MINFNDKKNRKVVSIVLIAVVILLIVAMVLPMMLVRYEKEAAGSNLKIEE